jgi:hypothetical protein
MSRSRLLKKQEEQVEDHLTTASMLSGPAGEMVDIKAVDVRTVEARHGSKWSSRERETERVQEPNCSERRHEKCSCNQW